MHSLNFLCTVIIRAIPLTGVAATKVIIITIIIIIITIDAVSRTSSLFSNPKTPWVAAVDLAPIITDAPVGI